MRTGAKERDDRTFSLAFQTCNYALRRYQNPWRYRLNLDGDPVYAGPFPPLQSQETHMRRHSASAPPAPEIEHPFHFQ